MERVVGVLRPPSEVKNRDGESIGNIMLAGMMVVREKRAVVSIPTVCEITGGSCLFARKSKKKSAAEVDTVEHVE